MSGIILILVAILWMVIAFFIAKLISMLLPEIWWAYLLRVVTVFDVTSLPIVDEIVGARQFEQLCRENSTIQVDRVKAAGKTVYLAEASNSQIEGTWVPVSVQLWRFVDATTGETVVSYKLLQASGGIVGPASLGPLTFNGFCAPANRPASVETFRELGIKYIEPPNKKREN